MMSGPLNSFLMNMAYDLNVFARIDHFASWHAGFIKKLSSSQDVEAEIIIGAKLIKDAANRASPDHAKILNGYANAIVDSEKDISERAKLINSSLIDLIKKYPDRSQDSTLPNDYPMLVETKVAQSSAWYEFFSKIFWQ